MTKPAGFLGDSLVVLLEGGEEPGQSLISRGGTWGLSSDAWRTNGFKLIGRAPRRV